MSQHQFPLEEIASLPDFYHPRASPEGDRVAYYYDGTGRNELYVRDLATGETTQVSDGTVPRDPKYPIVWHPDGDRVFFHRDEGGDEQNDVYAIDLDGTVEPLIEGEGMAVLVDVAPDGRDLLFASTRSGQMNLHVYDAATGEVTQVTDYEQPVKGAIFGPDAERIAYNVNETDDLENLDAYVASVDLRSAEDRPVAGDDVDGDAARKLDVGGTGVETGAVAWSPDGSRILVGDESPDLGRVGVYDLDTDDVTWYESDYEETPQCFLPDGDGFLAERVRDGGTVLVRYDLDGTARELDLDDGMAGLAGSHRDECFLGDGELLTTYERADRRAELHRYDLDEDESEVVLEAEYGSFDPDQFADCEVVTYESTDGLEIEGLLYEPAGDRDESGAPAVVMVHGGPQYRAAKRFDYRVQYLVDRGYAVFQPNYRGSTGHGREFRTAIHGDWGGMEQEDVVAGGRWLKDRDWIDEDRVAVVGGSYGGYSAYMQLVKYPEEWATGVASIGITHLPSLFEESMPHFKTNLRKQMGDPEANADLYEERSPLTHVEDIRRPLLMVHGVNDPRCPVSQARMFRDALEEEKGWTEGEDFVYEELGEQGHGSRDVDQRIRSLRIMADYLDDWL